MNINDNNINSLINKNYRNISLEAEVQKDILTLLTLMDIERFRINVMKAKTSSGRLVSSGVKPGFPDIFGYTNKGNIFFVEVKRPDGKGKQSKEQIEFELNANKHGAIYILANHPKQVYDKLKGI